MATEAWAWGEGQVSIWTGTASAVVPAYAQNTRVTVAYGWDNFVDLTGVYHDNATGQRADLTIGALWCMNHSALLTMAHSQTAVHVHLRHSGIMGTAGLYLYSGRIDAYDLNGSEGDLYSINLAYHANAWSAY